MIRWLAVVAMLAGCFGPATNTCGDGTTCPASKVCSPLGGCAGPDQLAACDGLGDGANCTASEIGDGTGVCQSGVCAATAWSPTVLIGGASEAVAISLSGPSGTALDPLGNVYITEPDHNRIWRVDTNGAATIVAGTGQFGFTGDGGPATSAQVGNPAGLAVDGIGNIYIADTSNQRIRRIDASGIITTVVGTGVAGYSGDEQPATSAELSNPSAVAVDGLGNLYIADTNNARIRRVDAITNVITTVAGDGTALAAPQGVAVDIQGNVWIADTGNNVIRELRARPPIALVTVAGTGMAGFSGDGGPAASATFNAPFGITADELGAVYVADRLNNRIRRIDPAGTISTVVGTGTPGFTGDGGPATSAEINDPYGVSVDSTGALYIVDFENNRIRHVDPAGMITTLAGTGLAVATGDGSAATDVLIENPGAVALDSHGNVIIADTSNNRVRRVDAAGVMATIAGTGHGGFTGDGGMATAADVTGPAGITFDGGGNLYFADAGNSCIRRIDTSGIITTVAGTGTQGFSGDGGPATSAMLSNPARVAVDAAGNLYVADNGNARVRRVSSTGVITTVAGNGTAGFSGDGGAATSAELSGPIGVAIDTDGSLYIADSNNNRVRRVGPTGIITTIAGGGAALGDGGAATNAQLALPGGIAIDTSHALFIADQQHERIRRVDAAGTITTAAGSGISGFIGDGGAAIAANLGDPVDVAVDGTGAVFIVDLFGHSIRRVSPAGVITTVAGRVDPGTMGPIAQAQLADPRALVLTPTWTLFAGGSSGTLQALAGGSLEVLAGRYPQNVATGSLARFRGEGFGTVSGVAYDAAANLIYVTQSSADQIEAITLVDPTDATTWTIAPLAGLQSGFADGPIAMASFRDPTGLYFDSVTRHLYVADTGNHVIRVIDLSSGIGGATVSTIAGAPETRGFFGDGGPAGDALLFAPELIAPCRNGDMFIADTGNHRVRRIATDGTISTVLGDGTASSSGEGSPASTFPVEAPHGLACDDLGNLFVTSTATIRMVLADAAGTVDGTGRVRTVYGLGAHDTFPTSVTRCLSGLAVIDTTTVSVIDSCTGFLLQLQREPAP